MERVVTCFPLYNGKVLLLKRSDDVDTYPDRWGTVTGYLERDSVKDQCREELHEELGIEDGTIQRLEEGEPYEFADGEYAWEIHPAIAYLEQGDGFDLNFENERYRWVDPQDVKMLDTVPNLFESLKRALKMRDEE